MTSNMHTSKLASMFLIPDNDNRRTFDEDNNLPSLPVPDISQTLARYLDSLEPFVTSEAYVKTKKLVAEFEQGIGQVLQEKLQKKAEKDRNWLEKWWEDVAYLQARQPLLLSSSMTGVLPKDCLSWTYGAEEDQVKHASLFAYYLVRFWDLIRREKLLPTRTADKKTNFSMSQYKKLFNTVRVPHNEKDSLLTFFKTAREGPCPSTVIVICKGRIFSVNALDKKGQIVSPVVWEEIYNDILNICKKSGDGNGVGTLSCDMRSTWSQNRNRLIEISDENSRILEKIDRSLFVMVLDDDVPDADSDVTNKNICGNYRNRWADKSICIIVYKNGRCGTLCDHSAFDGIVALSCLHYVVTAIGESHGEWEKESVRAVTTDVPEVEELNFIVDEELMSEIRRVELETSTFKDEIDMSVHAFDDFGKLEIQRLKFHPDSFVQMCLQLAYVVLHGKPATCYETATTRKFYNGRTETVRSCTTECLDWVLSMLDEKRSNEERKDLLERAVKRHDELMSEARENRGCDRHLFGLHCLAVDEGIDIPELFRDPSYFLSGGGGNFILSTSCTGYSPLGGGVAPMREDGYGVFYNILPNSIHFMVSVNKRSWETNVAAYFKCIKSSFARMREVVLRAGKVASKL